MGPKYHRSKDALSIYNNQPDTDGAKQEAIYKGQQIKKSTTNGRKY